MSIKNKWLQLQKKEYERLFSDSDFLYWLQAYGVDNWEGYSDDVSPPF